MQGKSEINLDLHFHSRDTLPMNDATSTHTTLEKTKRKNQHGADYWTARSLMSVLEYDRWENFEAVLEFLALL